MWSQVEAAIEELRPVIEAYGLSPSVVDVLDGEVTIGLASTGAGLAFPENLPDLLERTLKNEVPGVTRVVVERPPVVTVRIEVEPPRPEATACRFKVDAVLAPDGTSLYFDDARDASSWPLVVALLDLRGVRGVILRAREVMISRVDDVAWTELMPQVEATIRAHVGGTAPKPRPAAAQRTPAEEADLRARVERVLEDEVNPAVAAHGGVIKLHHIEGDTAWLHMGGGCQGCGMAAVTLRQGVERLLLAAVPEITAIRDATDHEAGSTPYYAS
jgi:Fe-S cluster biogenesis protein NfuA